MTNKLIEMEPEPEETRTLDEVKDAIVKGATAQTKPPKPGEWFPAWLGVPYPGKQCREDE